MADTFYVGHSLKRSATTIEGILVHVENVHGSRVIFMFQKLARVGFCSERMFASLLSCLAA